MNITQSEVLDALREALSVPDAADGITSAEVRHATGRGYSVVREWLLKEVTAGRVECVLVKRPKVDGVVQLVTGYRIVR